MTSALAEDCVPSDEKKMIKGIHDTKIAMLRKSKMLTQLELAEMVGTTFRWVQKLESGETDMRNITLDKAIKLARALGIEPEDLLK